jgi:hypothetical protein
VANESLAEVVRSLTPQEQDAVRQFIDYLKRRDPAVSNSPILQAADEVTRYPTIEEALAVHSKLILLFGGSGGLRDGAALESAVARPRSGYYTDLIREAAALRESLSQNHAFVDRNKRMR